MTDLLIREAQPTDAPVVAALANRYTYQQLDEAGRRGGFLTGQFTAESLAAMLASVPGQVAFWREELVGFVVNSHLPAERYGPLVQLIAARLPELTYQQRPLTAYRWFYYGPALVAQAHRGQGLLRQLFAASCRTLAGRYEVGIAFIAADNAASLCVHVEKLGLVEVGRVQWQEKEYSILAFSVKELSASELSKT